MRGKIHMRGDPKASRGERGWRAEVGGKACGLMIHEERENCLFTMETQGPDISASDEASEIIRLHDRIASGR